MQQTFAVRSGGALITGAGATAGFLAICALMMTIVATRLPLSDAEIGLLARTHGGTLPWSDALSPGRLLTALGADVFSAPWGHRAGPVAATILGFMTLLALSRTAGFAPQVGRLAIALCATSPLLFYGGSLIGAGAAGVLALGLFGAALLRQTRLRGTTFRLLFCATALVILCVPELATSVLALAVIPFLFADCRHWLRRSGFWATLGMATILVMPAAHINGIATVWPVMSGTFDSDPALLFSAIVTLPVMLFGIVVAATRIARRQKSDRDTTVLALVVLAGFIGLVASGLRPSVLMAAVPMALLFAASVIVDQGNRLARTLSETALPLSTLTLLGSFWILLVTGPGAVHSIPMFRGSAGWTAVALEMDALAQQNDVGWIAVESPADAILLSNAHDWDKPVVLAGSDTPGLIDCRMPGLMIGQTAWIEPLTAFRRAQILTPTTRMNGRAPLQQRGLALVATPIDGSLCR